ncbi:chromosome partitioning protein ParB [Williamsia sterculiae]|uniref:ParB-like nuclease domain-containing protein n=1 Tax=Williamsia sterculiae TaxID=1344003 RepID=A0A1N7E112_9NOCA|nr:chromosome partitioning protein ParB [Williamsia sterculiae]SIR81760.1 hypothetical protein SAMN05445060_1082 [Williamsia sterculiae]
MARDTGFPDADAENDFSRLRRRAELARLAAWFTRQPRDVTTVLPFDDVVRAVGRVSERSLGLQSVPVDAIVGSVDRTGDFDRYFRPTSARVRARWQRLAAAQRRGESVPPIQLYKVGSMYFVIDGHHRVSIAIARSDAVIDAYVTEILTRVSADGISGRSDLVLKDMRRLFLSRVPLAGRQAEAIALEDAEDYAELAENIEAWGFRLSQEIGEFVGRTEAARRWFGEEFLPVVRMARRAEILPEVTSDAELYMRLACERYRLVRKHVWDDEVIEELRTLPRRRRRG